MNTFRLRFTENMTAHHEMIIETELSENEFLEELDTVKFNDSRIDDCAYLLEKQLKVNVKEIIEGDPETDDIDCDDVAEIKEV